MRIVAEPLTAEAFKPYGAVLEGPAIAGRVYFNDTLANGRAQAPVSLSVATVAPTKELPLVVKVLERHEHSSQSFIPLSVSRYSQSSRYPAFSMFLMSRRNLLSWIFSARIETITWWSKDPKQPEMSPSMNQVVPDQTSSTSRSAVWHPQPGRKPWERPENCGS